LSLTEEDEMSRSDAEITVLCDRCEDYSTDITITALAGRRQWDERNVNRQLEREGWQISDGEDICPECVETLREEQGNGEMAGA
jgi:hypothetical protein